MHDLVIYKMKAGELGKDKPEVKDM